MLLSLPKPPILWAAARNPCRATLKPEQTMVLLVRKQGNLHSRASQVVRIGFRPSTGGREGGNEPKLWAPESKP